MDEISGIPYIDEGIRAGMERACRYELAIPDEVLSEPRIAEEFARQLTDVINSWPEHLNERFLVLFVENATVAAIARHVYEAFPLQERDMGFLFTTRVRSLPSLYIRNTLHRGGANGRPRRARWGRRRGKKGHRKCRDPAEPRPATLGAYQ